MTTSTDDLRLVRRNAQPLRAPHDLDPLLSRIGSARYVLIGEATHGTHEFYRWRAELTTRLITERGFSFVAVEGDWPDCHRLHCCVAGAPGVPNDPRQVLWGFQRWPTWMWANEEVADFAAWLRGFNTQRGEQPPVGFHGLDVYSLWDSLRGITEYLARHAPDRLDAAHAAFRCFEPFAEDPQQYAMAAELVPEDCHREVVGLLTELRARSAGEAAPALDPDFVARQNAEVVAGAERYYRELVRGGPHSWNVRDIHMADTLDRLAGAYGPGAKAVVWAHNTHVGDARATDMPAAGLVNLGQLVRERHTEDGVVTIGFGTHRGQVIAADHWGGPTRRMPVPPAQPGSLEDLLHQAVPDAGSVYVLDRVGWAAQVRGHRAIGVVYRPGTSRAGGYVPTVPAARYDAFVHCDDSRALTPLHPWEPEVTELETYPTGE